MEALWFLIAAVFLLVAGFLGRDIYEALHKALRGRSSVTTSNLKNPGAARFLPRMVGVQIANRQDDELRISPGANVSYVLAGDGSFTDEVRLLNNTSLEVRLAAAGVKIEAVDPERGIGSVIVRWA